MARIHVGVCVCIVRVVDAGYFGIFAAARKQMDRGVSAWSGVCGVVPFYT